MGMGGILGAICLFFPPFEGQSEGVGQSWPHFGGHFGVIWLVFSILKAILADFPSFWGTFWGKFWFFSSFARGMLGVIWLFFSPFGAVWGCFFPHLRGAFLVGFPSFWGYFGGNWGVWGGKSGPQFWKIGAQIGPEFSRRPKKKKRLILAQKPYKTRVFLNFVVDFRA